jgi:hypothetical protein
MFRGSQSPSLPALKENPGRALAKTEVVKIVGSLKT